MVSCDKCGKRINDPKEVNVLAFLLVKPVTMCNNCYALRERGYLRHILYVPRMFPINSKPFFVLLIIATLFLIIIISAIFKQAGFFSAQFLVALLISLIIIWAWRLWFIARNVVNQVKRKL